MLLYARFVTDRVPESLHHRLSYLLGTLHRRALGLETDALARVTSGVKQHAALAVLADEGAMTQRELGARLGIDRTTVVAVVDDLEDAGLVERTRHRADRRAYLVTPSRSGHTALRRGRRLVEQAEATLLAALDERERRTLTDLLAKATLGSGAAADDEVGVQHDVAGR